MTDSTRQSGKPDKITQSDDDLLLSEVELPEEDFFSEEETAPRPRSSSRSSRTGSSAKASRKRSSGRSRKTGRPHSRRSGRGRKRHMERSDYIHLALLAVILLMFLIGPEKNDGRAPKEFVRRLRWTGDP